MHSFAEVSFRHAVFTNGPIRLAAAASIANSAGAKSKVEEHVTYFTKTQRKLSSSEPRWNHPFVQLTRVSFTPTRPSHSVQPKQKQKQNTTERLDTVPPPKTFAEVLSSKATAQPLRKNQSDLQKFFLTDSNPPTLGTKSCKNGRTTLAFSDTEIEELAARFNLALIGKFSHGAPSYCNLHRLIAGLGVKGEFTVTMINAKHVVISLSHESDYSRLWLRRIWYLHGYPMRIFKWSPTFTPGQESSVVPVWACLPELPAHLFHKNALFTIASMIGTPLQIDDFTFNQSKLSKARICVEIDVTHSLMEEFDILIHGTTITQKVEYEQVPHYCRLCKHVGHQDTECYSKGNATKPHRRIPDAKQYHKQGKNVVEYQARRVLDRMPETNLTRTEVGEFAVDRQRYVPEAVVINAHKEISELPQLIHSDEIEIIHAENDVLAVENDVLTAENEVGMVNVENEVVVHVNFISSLAENNISTAENENAFEDVACNAEIVITCDKGDANGLHVVDDASIRVGDDDVNAILCVENAKVIEETEMVERNEAEIMGKEAEI
ncbi:UNVERIFIED_CONTAM: hypothetical protein Sangu_1584000 [Sesamum angustifolium]|uniref:DUF4283 domain-containing protein n=1 Tax=Sesamum angustifolium TaxID=2727405 RepID=A0AAW2MTI3_9LAMI